jgi:hypothetical protein
MEAFAIRDGFRNQGRILTLDISKQFFHELQFCPMLSVERLGYIPLVSPNHLLFRLGSGMFVSSTARAISRSGPLLSIHQVS